MDDYILKLVVVVVVSWTAAFLFIRKIFPHRSFDFSNRLVSTIHATLAVTLTSLSVQDWRCPVCPLASNSSHRQLQTLAWTLAYFIYDLVCCLFDRVNVDHTIHHLISIVGIGASLVYEKSGSELVAALWITEISSPFLHYREMLKELDYRDTGLNLYTQSSPHHQSSNSSQVVWQDSVDPDNMTYEELLDLGETVGTQSRGLSQEQINLLPTSKYKFGNLFLRKRSGERCVICQMKYKRGDRQMKLPCRHVYHSECITKTLGINKICPICNNEIYLLVWFGMLLGMWLKLECYWKMVGCWVWVEVLLSVCIGVLECGCWSIPTGRGHYCWKSSLKSFCWNISINL